MSDEFMRATTRDDEHLALTTALGFRSYLAVPIATDGRVLGSLTMVSCGRPFHADDVAFAECLAQQVGAVARKAHELDLTVRTSHILQMSLLPERLPDVPGMSVHSRYEAVSTALEVGGDFYDLMLLADGQVWFTIGDVEGHDRTAAAVMGQLRSAARTLALQGRSPAQLVSDLRLAWSALGFERMATGLFGQMDPASGKTTLVSAGHLPPLLVSGGEATYLPVPPSPPLGVAADAPGEWAVEVGRGDLLFLYTDGAINDRALGIEEGMALLAKTVASGDSDPTSICSRVVNVHGQGDDDIALLVLKRSKHA
jgi:serine phosphatase RsbU (regulator of sigma subunit)